MSDDEKDRAAFWNMIRMAPSNDANRLVFADWCEEHGDMKLAEMLRGGSRKWIEEQASCFDMNYETLMEHIASEDLIVEYDSESWRDHWYDICGDFWKHYKVMTGVDKADDHETPFTCSC